MATMRRSKMEILERGDLFFLYRPSEGRYEPGSLLDVRRFYMVLRPQGQDLFRLIAIGKKKLPDGEAGPERHWGFVDGIFREPAELRRAAAGIQALLGSSDENLRPAGEGLYALTVHGNHTHLVYVLELPLVPGEVQAAFQIRPEGRFVIAVKNPEASSPPGVGLEGERQPRFPETLLRRFGDRRWIPADPPDFLDCEGAEILLIGGRDDLGQALGIDLIAQPEDADTAEIFRELQLERSDRNLKPLLKGLWE